MKKKFQEIIDETPDDVIQVFRTLNNNLSKYQEKMMLMTKAMMVLVLNELITDDTPIERVEEKYEIARSHLHPLKSEAGNFAKMAASFCNKLEWEKHELHFNKLKIKCLPGEKFDLDEYLSQKKARDSELEDTAAMSAPTQKKQKIEHQPPAADSTPGMRY